MKINIFFLIIFFFTLTLIYSSNDVSLQALVNYKNRSPFKEYNVVRGGTVNLKIPYDRSWVLEADGIFKEGKNGRILIGNPTKSIHERGVDWFFWGTNKLRIRLYNRKINFEYNNVKVGSVTTPAPPDHQARTNSISIQDGATHKLRVEYNLAAKNMQVYADNVLVGDYQIIVKKTPSPVNGLKAEGFSGKIRLKIENRNSNTTTASGNTTTTSANIINTTGNQQSNWAGKSVKPGDIMNVDIPFDKNWLIEMSGVFQASTNGNRFFNGNRNVKTRRLDFFWGSNKALCFKLASYRIYFTKSFNIGTVKNSFPSTNTDNYASTGSLTIDDGKSHKLKAEYDIVNKRYKVYIDGNLSGDYAFIVKTLPIAAKQIFIDRFTGIVKYSVGSTNPPVANTNTGNQATSTNTQITLDSNNTGTKTFKFTSAGTVEITPLLSTSSSAEIKAVITKSNGTKITWLKWKRTSGHDQSPLYENGTKVSGSMVNSGRDWSPKRPPDTYKQTMAIGDQVEISLTGSFGIGSPYVKAKINGKTTSSGATASTSGTTSSSSSSSGGPSGSGWNTFNVKQNDSIKINIPFNRKWEVEYDMTVIAVTHSGAGHPRMFECPGHFIEILNARGSSLGFRLANRKIWFQSASKGKVESPGANTNHYLNMSARARTGSTHKIKIDYDNSRKNVKIYMDGNLIGDSVFQERSRAKAVTSMKFPFSEGTFSYKLK